jgi:competence protein ComEC
MVLTHPHPDHLNGLVAVARNFRIGEFWEAYPPPPSETGAYCDLGDALRPEVLRRRVFRGYARRIGSAAVSVLHPGAEDGPSTPASENDLSLVLRISFGGTAVLFTGDIEARAEREILERGAEVSCAVLKSPHHGSSTSSSAPFLARARPGIVLISVGQGNRFGFPGGHVLDRYRRAGSRVYRTDVDGAVEVSTDGVEIRVRTASGISTSH